MGRREAIAALGLGVALGLAFEVGAGHVVEQELELDAEPALVAFEEMPTDRVLVLDEGVEAAVEAVVVDLLPTDSEKILQSALAIPPLGDFQLAAVAAEAGDGEDAGDHRPRHDLAASGEKLRKQGVQAEAPPQGEREVDLAEVAHPPDAQAAHVHLHPLRRVRRRSGGHGFGGLASLAEKIQLDLTLGPGLSVEEGGEVLPPVELSAVETWQLAEVGHQAMARAALGANRLHQAPVFVGLAVLRAAVALQEHVQSCLRRSSGATGWSRLHAKSAAQRRPHQAPERKSDDIHSFFSCSCRTWVKVTWVFASFQLHPSAGESSTRSFRRPDSKVTSAVSFSIPPAMLRRCESRRQKAHGWWNRPPWDSRKTAR